MLFMFQKHNVEYEKFQFTATEGSEIDVLESDYLEGLIDDDPVEDDTDSDDSENED